MQKKRTYREREILKHRHGGRALHFLRSDEGRIIFRNNFAYALIERFADIEVEEATTIAEIYRSMPRVQILVNGEKQTVRI